MNKKIPDSNSYLMSAPWSWEKFLCSALIVLAIVAVGLVIEIIYILFCT